MTNRRKSRILAMQMLYQLDTGKFAPHEILNNFQKESKFKIEINNFAVVLFSGTVEHLEQINEIINSISSNWLLSRMPYVDRNIIRLAIYEILYLNDIPKSVTINEAIEIAKKYGSGDSGKFINGILDKVNKPEIKVNNTPDPSQNKTL